MAVGNFMNRFKEEERRKKLLELQGNNPVLTPPPSVSGIPPWLQTVGNVSRVMNYINPMTQFPQMVADYGPELYRRGLYGVGQKMKQDIAGAGRVAGQAGKVVMYGKQGAPPTPPAPSQYTNTPSSEQMGPYQPGRGPGQGVFLGGVRGQGGSQWQPGQSTQPPLPPEIPGGGPNPLPQGYGQVNAPSLPGGMQAYGSLTPAELNEVMANQQAQAQNIAMSRMPEQIGPSAPSFNERTQNNAAAYGIRQSGVGDAMNTRAAMARELRDAKTIEAKQRVVAKFDAMQQAGLNRGQELALGQQQVEAQRGTNQAMLTKAQIEADAMTGAAGLRGGAVNRATAIRERHDRAQEILTRERTGSITKDQADQELAALEGGQVGQDLNGDGKVSPDEAKYNDLARLLKQAERVGMTPYDIAEAKKQQAALAIKLGLKG